MQVKRFVAADMAQAMRQVRQILGPDAVILSTGRLPGGEVEISAAVDGGPIVPTPAELEGPRGAARTAPRPAAPQAPAPAAEPAWPAAPDKDDDWNLEEDGALDRLSRQVQELSQQLSRHLVATEAAQGFLARPEVAPIYQHLKSQEVDPAIIGVLLNGMSSPDGRGLWPRLAIRLKKVLKTSPPPNVGLEGPVVWALVGPTGVGKTTTLAKLAAVFALKRGLRVGLVTVDTYRIAAAEQLKVYGQIMELPTLVASTPGEYDWALRELADMDMILVDTVGRSPRDQDNLDELWAVLMSRPETNCQLVMACPTRDSDQRKITRSFRKFEPKSLIFTKLDETDIYGPIMNQVVGTGLPISYVTTGQKVPDDLEEATSESLARRLLPSRGTQPAAR